MYRKVEYVKDLKDGKQVKDIFVVKFKKPIREFPKGYSFSLRVGDKTKEIMLKYWHRGDKQEIEKIYDMISRDDVIYVEGYVKKYKENLEIEANNIKVLDPSEYKLEDFVAVTPKDINKMFEKLLGIIESIENKELKKLLQSLFLNKEFSESFKKSPAALYKHQNYIGGLLEHTLNVVSIVEHFCSIHKLDKDLAITGAIIHDIGKVDEFEVTNNIRVSAKGHLVGHITLGVSYLSKLMEELDINEITKLKLIHIVLSHHGSLENASPKPPMFPEALAVYLADLSDSQLSNMIKTKTTAETEDEFVYTKDFGNVFLK